MTRWEPVMVCCEHGEEPSISIKGGECAEYLRLLFRISRTLADTVSTVARWYFDFGVSQVLSCVFRATLWKDVAEIQVWTNRFSGRHMKFASEMFEWQEAVYLLIFVNLNWISFTTLTCETVSSLRTNWRISFCRSEWTLVYLQLVLILTIITKVIEQLTPY